MKLRERIRISMKYRVERARYILYSSYNKAITKYINPPIVKNTEDTIKKIIVDRCSVSRYGEGEFKLMYGKNLVFQDSSPELIDRMKEIIQKQSSNHIVCIPDVFENIDRFNTNAYRFWKEYINTDRKKIYNLLDMNQIYYDSLMTRVYMDYKEKNKSEYLFQQLRKIWNHRDITIVEGYESRLGIGNDLFDNVDSINRILCPAKNAFSKYDEILNCVKKIDKNRLILVALGPTATVLTYDLAQLGYQAIDIGHVDIEYEWFLQGATEKCEVKNKFVGEVINGRSINSNLEDNVYEKQIIKKIV